MRHPKSQADIAEFFEWKNNIDENEQKPIYNEQENKKSLRKSKNEEKKDS